MGISGGVSFATSNPLTTADVLTSGYGGLLGYVYKNGLTDWVRNGVGVVSKTGDLGVVEKIMIELTRISPIFAGKQIAVPLGNSTGLGDAIDPLFDPAKNPWWGYDNLLKNLGD